MALGDDFNKVNVQGAPPLFRAVEKGAFSKAQAMLQAGADANAVTKRRNLIARLLTETPYAEGSTALHAACLGGDNALVLLLLDYKADPNIKNIEGRTAMDEALTSYTYYRRRAAILKREGRMTGFGKAEAKYLNYAAIIQDLQAAGGKSGLLALPPALKISADKKAPAP